MNAAAKRRWRCPSCGKGILAPSRLRKIDTRRYCLPCSEKAGVLVERVCVSAEAARERKAATRRDAPARREASLRQRAVVQARTQSDEVVTVDVLAELADMAKMLGMKTPKLTVARRSRHGATSGHAVYSEQRIHLAVWANVGTEAGQAERLYETMLHEAVHLKVGRLGPRGGREHHGPRFKRVLADAARERWPGIEFDETPVMHSGRAYDLDDVIVAALRRRTMRDLKGSTP